MCNYIVVTTDDNMNEMLEKWSKDKILGQYLKEESLEELDIGPEDFRSTAAALESINKEWENKRKKAFEQGIVAGDNNLLREYRENGKEWTYAMPDNDFWNGEDWMYLREGSLDDESKIHHTSENPLEEAYMASIFQKSMRSNNIPYHLKVDALDKYDFDGRGGKHVSILYVDGENLDQALNSLNSMKRGRNLPDSDHYKETIDPETYEREKGFVVRDD